jgi:YbbR domain-containing protein
MRNSSILQFTLRNLGWMSVSILLALMIWVAANMSSNPVEQSEIDGVQVRVELPDGFVLSRPPDTQSVTAVVRATHSQMGLILPGDILVTADMRNLHDPGEYRIELEAEVASPLHGKVLALRPSTLTLSIDREIEQRMAIQVVVTNDPPLGYTYPPDIPCDQTEVVVRGSADRVAAVQRVEARLNLSDDLNPTTKTVNLTPVQENGLRAQNVDLVPATVTCTVNIQAREDVFQMPVLPRVKGSPPPGYDFKGYSSVNPDSVGLTGDRNAIRSLPGLVRTTPIDLTNRTETFTAEVPVDLPAGVTLVPENQLISVTVVIQPQVTTRSFEDVPVEVTGLDPTQYRATGLADTVTVFVSGPPDKLPTLDNLRVVVDLTDLGAGNHQVKPEGTFIGMSDTSGLTLTISPDELSVTIEALNPTPTPTLTLTPEPTSTPAPGDTPIPTAAPTPTPTS